MKHARNTIFVKDDDPEFLDAQFEPKAELVDLEAVNAVDFLQAARTRDSIYDTAPFDPSGSAFRFYPANYTVWSGKPGAGKTTILKQLTCHLLHAGKPVFLASMEQDPDAVLYDLCQVAHGKRDLSVDNVQWCFDAWGESLKLWSYRRGIASHEKIFGIIAVLARKGVRHAIIDSLTRLDIPATDWEGQREFANRLTALCAQTGVHVHLVAHPKKPQRKSEEPDMDDVAGASDISRLADNVLFVARKTDEADFHKNVTEMTVKVLKQRFTAGGVGPITGVFNRAMRQWKPHAHEESVTRYLPDGAYGELMYRKGAR